MAFFSTAYAKVTNTFFDAGIISWDVLLTLLNLVQRKRREKHVTPEGHPGYGGHWPEFRPAQEGDSRCSCPALNAMANHGIIPRSGRNITFTELNHQIRSTYNFGASFCSFVPHFAARLLHKSYSKDTFDLEELDLHNGIEHDASLTRLDSACQKDQSVKHLPFIEELLSAATGKDQEHDILTVKDLAKIQGKRRAEARATNPEFSLSLFHKMFGSSNSSTLLTIFGGRINDIRSILIDERIPEGWESRVRQPHGLTITRFNATVLRCEFGTREKDFQVTKGVGGQTQSAV
ncbi:Chloroperoxidase [Hygrophoropsis aurantiaca]|uniref:Chloroperoxidase n=1 Tax=Hygrophoropsis aurantiaca TaxID=72124 RepID=A0ACB8AR83_9AGAM|nr:Chloroperoxidase [Hygrophoropsis aurantiaca]